jgi:tetratricopeptide (TPR) repeat protein
MLNLRPIFLLALFSFSLQAESPAAKATRFNNEAARLYANGQYSEAEKLYRAALSLDTGDGLRVAIMAGNLGTLYKHLDRYQEAERAYSQALELRRKLLPPNRPELAYSLNNLADIYRIEGRYWEAHNLTQAAVRSLEVINPQDPEMPILLSNLGVLERYLNHPLEAEQLLRSAISSAEQLLGPKTKPVTLALNNLAQVLEDKRDYEGAEALYLRAAPILEELGPACSYDLAIVLANLGRMQQRAGRLEAGKQNEQKALALIDGSVQPNTVIRAEIFRTLGNILAAEGHADQSIAYFERSLALEEKVLGDLHPSVAETLRDYSAAALQAGRKSLATKLSRRAERAWEGHARTNPGRFSVDANALRDFR